MLWNAMPLADQDPVHIPGNPKLVVACVGTATGDALVNAGVVPAFVPSKATGKTLVRDPGCLDPIS